MSGTSMAAPHVVGVAALLLQAYPGAPVSTIRDRMAAAAVAKTFSTSSPSRLLNAMTSRLVGGLWGGAGLGWAGSGRGDGRCGHKCRRSVLSSSSTCARN